METERRTSSTAYRAFTLIELLVVIGVIALLASLLLSTVARAKRTANSTVCKSNLRQIGFALQMYASEFGYYPPAALNPPPNVFRQSKIWMDLLRPYLGAEKGELSEKRVLYCGENLDKSLWAIAGLKGNYGYNTFGTDIPKGVISLEKFRLLGLGSFLSEGDTDFISSILLRDSQVRTPSEMIAIGDVNHGAMGPQTGTIQLHPFGFDRVSWPGLIHNGRANIVFCDAHVEIQSQTNWMAATEVARRRWNNDNQPHLETWPKP